MGCATLLAKVWALRRVLIIMLTPFLLAPLPVAVPGKEARCAYVILLMAVYWVTEVLPMAVTALIPVVLMPALGVMGSKAICINYFQDTIMLFFGGLMVAVAVEKWMLHKRIALRVLLLVGTRPKWLMFGFMATTAFLSMWISNTATTAMMVPIVQAVLSELKTKPKISTEHAEQNGTIEHVELKDTELPEEELKTLPESEVVQIEPDSESTTPEHYVRNSRTEGKDKEEQAFDTMAKGMVICCAYSANIGGFATLTGTATNVVFKGQLDTIYNSRAGVTYSNWMIFAFPNMVVTLVITWLGLQIFFLGPRALCEWRCSSKDSASDQAAGAVIRKEYEKLGPVSFAEAAVLAHFVILAVLWITRNPEFVPGWGALFEGNYMTDATAAILISILLFVCPSRRPSWSNCCVKDDHQSRSDLRVVEQSPTLLDWKAVVKGLPWSVLLVIGGGFAMADACKQSGLSYWIGLQFNGLRVLSPWLMVIIICIMIATFTEVTSNVATLTIFMPILAEMSANLGIHPLYIIIPACISTSFAFMLPVATPPNAIVFSYGYLHIKDMVLAGLIPKVLCILVVNIAINSWGVAMFNLHSFPDWAGNITVVANHVNNVTNVTGSVLTNATGFVV